MQRTFDVEAVRAEFPALSRFYRDKPVALFDGPGGSQVARSSIEAMTGYMERSGANLPSRRAPKPRGSWPAPGTPAPRFSAPIRTRSPSGPT